MMEINTLNKLRSLAIDVDMIYLFNIESSVELLRYTERYVMKTIFKSGNF